jgi:hypothetical protein
MKWQEGLLTDAGSRDMTVGRHYCTPCKVNAKMQESRGIKKGRRLAKAYEGINCLDKRILCLPSAVQIGILRERAKGITK